MEVWDDYESDPIRKIFSHVGEDYGEIVYECFAYGDEWTSRGATEKWKYCKKWKDEDEPPTNL